MEIKLKECQILSQLLERNQYIIMVCYCGISRNNGLFLSAATLKPLTFKVINIDHPAKYNVSGKQWVMAFMWMLFGKVNIPRGEQHSLIAVGSHPCSAQSHTAKYNPGRLWHELAKKRAKIWPGLRIHQITNDRTCGRKCNLWRPHLATNKTDPQPDVTCKVGGVRWLVSNIIHMIQGVPAEHLTAAGQ